VALILPYMERCAENDNSRGTIFDVCGCLFDDCEAAGPAM
jgi:hypothetical protein